MTLKQRPSHTDQEWIQTLAFDERDKPCLLIKVLCLKDDTACAGNNTFQEFREEKICLE